MKKFFIACFSLMVSFTAVAEMYRDTIYIFHRGNYVSARSAGYSNDDTNIAWDGRTEAKALWEDSNYYSDEKSCAMAKNRALKMALEKCNNNYPGMILVRACETGYFSSSKVKVKIEYLCKARTVTFID